MQNVATYVFYCSLGDKYYEMSKTFNELLVSFSLLICVIILYRLMQNKQVHIIIAMQFCFVHW